MMQLTMYVFDVDGVLVDSFLTFEIYREMKKYKRMNELSLKELLKLDRPRKIGIDLYRDRAQKGAIAVVTGRPRELYEITLQEIVTFTGRKPDFLFMRENTDKRAPKEVKLNFIEHLIKKVEIKEIHDDDIALLNELKHRYPYIKLYYHYLDTYQIIN